MNRPQVAVNQLHWQRLIFRRHRGQSHPQQMP
jgi:hypothetical protein